MDQVGTTGLYRVDFESMLREWKDGVPNGQTSHIKALDDIFKWMPGSIAALYGWPNDGKGTFFDFLAVMRCMFDDDKRFLMMKQEDMSSTRFGTDKPRITANRIHRGLMWTYTGKCPDKNFVNKYGGELLTDPKEVMRAMEWVDSHFYVISPKDRSWSNVRKMIAYSVEEFGITDILIDPFKSLKLKDEGGRADFMLDDLFIEAKELAIETNTSLTFIAHPKSNIDVRESKDKNAPYKIVTQWMVAGGSPWDNNMDAQYSGYRPFRHNNPNAPEFEFYNLKQRNAEEVLAQKGMVSNIKFDRLKRRYYFDGVCPIDGDKWTDVKFMKQAPIDYTEPKKELKSEDLPF